jgi:hypothetical protein
MRFNSSKYRALNESISRLDEAPGSGVEGDYEGEMARGELKSLIANAQELLKMLGEDEEIEAWVQSKITKAADYISSVRNYMVGDTVNEAVAAWQRKEGKNPEGGLNKAGVESYRRANPGSKLQTAVTTKPSKLKPGSKSANRRKSFCSRMQGMKSKLTSAKTANDPDSRINKSLRKWNCR